MIFKLPELFQRKKNNKVKPVVMISLDGWGLAPPSHGNAITLANTPNMDYFYANYPHGQLIASGESVGLPATEVGNSEVGHLTMGVGRVIFQSLLRINNSIDNGSFFENEAFEKAATHALQHKSKLHILGLVGSGNVHSNLDHMYALLQFCKKEKLTNVELHLFTDGRDAPPDEGVRIMAEIKQRVDFMAVGRIASISGRYWAMDRDSRWERIQKAYDAIITGSGKQAVDPVEAMKQSYAEGKSDEFVEPTVISGGSSPAGVNDNDACIFFNFRVDRARELAMAFSMPDFETADLTEYGLGGQTFTRQKAPKNLFIVTMTEYVKKLPVSAVAFPPETEFPDSLPEIFSRNNIPQLDLAESEKERMVAYYFRGMRSKPFPGEDVIIVPSPRVPTYDKKPEMSAPDIVREFTKAIKRDHYGFIVINFANPDMVAHTGNIKAAIKGLEAVDKALGEIYHLVMERDGVILISADHGNAEEMLTFPLGTFFYTTDQGVKNTDHSSNPVPIIIMANSLRGQSSRALRGTLGDIAPTILGIMKLPVPEVMRGKDLLASSVQPVNTGGMPTSPQQTI